MKPCPPNHHGSSRLIDDRSLENSSVVANRVMNRERQAVGVNSYEKELHFHPLRFLEQCLKDQGHASWLDLCCGRGRALIAAAQHFAGQAGQGQVSLEGIDLVPFFDPVPSGLDFPALRTSSVHDWKPLRGYDLITCVHGLHYLGDKLSVIARAVSALEPQGAFLANIDFHSVIFDEAKPPERRLLRTLREAGLAVDLRRHLVSCIGPRTITCNWSYLGADDQAGPNYTDQRAVASHYRWAAARNIEGLPRESSSLPVRKR